MAKEIVKPTLTKASSNGASWLSFEPDILAPHQYLKNCQRTNPAEPEKALMLAVLAEAVDSIKDSRSPSPAAGKRFFVKWKLGFGGRNLILFSRF